MARRTPRPIPGRAAEIARQVRERRVLVPLAASVLYVSAVALRAHDGAPLRPVALGIVALAVVAVAARTRAATAPILGWRALGGERTRLAMWGLALCVAALGADARGWLDVAAVAGAALGFVNATRAVGRMAGGGGLGATLVARGRWEHTAGLALGSVAWACAIASSAGWALGAGWEIAHAPRAWSAGASIASGLILLRLTTRAARARRLDLGVPARAHALAGITAAAMTLGAVASALDLAAPERIARVVTALAGVVVAEVALAVDAVKIAHAARRIIALALVAGPVVLLGMTVAAGRPRDAAAVTAATAVLALVVGMGARIFEDPLRPAQGVWLDAVKKAHDALLRADPEDAVKDVLGALREPAGGQGISPILFTLHPSRATTIDRAGYTRTKEAELPAGLLDVAAREPEAALRTEVLAALEVRRPDLRPMLRWLIDRGAMLAVVVVRAGEAEGLLVVPDVPRSDAVSLEEVRAVKGLADALAGAIHTRAALARSMERERDAREKAEAAEDGAARLQHEVELGVGRNALAASRLARPATVGIYSAASRMALDAIERRVNAGGPIALVVPSGVDAAPYLARAHLEGPRARGPFVVVDGTSSREHDAARWADPAVSPLGLADGGTLVLLDGAALPIDVQRLVARALAERRAPWERPEPLDVELGMTGVLPPAELVDEGRLDAALAARLGDALDAPIALPRLRDRAEDLRAILTDRLAREGLRVLGRPVGLEDAAYARILERPRIFDGEDVELQALAQRLVARLAATNAPDPVIRAPDVAAVFAPAPEDAADEPAAPGKSSNVTRLKP